MSTEEDATLTPFEFKLYWTAFAGCAGRNDEGKYWAATCVLHWRKGGPQAPFPPVVDAMFACAKRMATEYDATIRLNSDKPLDFITHDELMRDLDDEEDVDATLRGMDKAMGAKRRKKRR